MSSGLGLSSYKMEVTSLSSIPVGRKGHDRRRAPGTCQELDQGHLLSLLLRTSPLVAPVGPSGKLLQVVPRVGGWLLRLGRKGACAPGLLETC